MEVTTAIHLDTRRAIQDGRFPVRIRVTYNRKRKYYSISNNRDSKKGKFYLSEDDYDKMMSKNVRGDLKEIKNELEEVEKSAIAIIDSMDQFSFSQFEQLFNERKFDNTRNKTVKHYFESYIKELKKDGQIGTAATYENAKNSIFTYWSENIEFDEITVGMLKSYKSQMLMGNIKKEIPPKSVTTVSIYTRCLRKLYNSAIIDGVVNQRSYPFGKAKDKKFEIPKHSNIKKALKIEDIKKIYDYQPKSEKEEFYRDIWLFSYLAYGMNIGDICDLQYDDIKKDRLFFFRNKTENKKPVQLQVLLSDKLKEIIDKYGTKDKYVFPVLDEKFDPVKRRSTIKQFTKMVNTYIQKIAKDIDLNEKISTQYARHSFATIARNNKIPDGIISQLMGHSQGKSVTSNYFDNEVPEFILKEVNRVLISWK